MNFDVNSVAPIIIAIITALGAYAGTKATTKAQREAAEPANWQSLTAEMKLFFREQLEVQNKRIDALETELNDTRAYITYLASMPEFTDPPFPSLAKWRANR